MKWIISLLFFVLPIFANASFRIIGGDYIDIEKVPYQAYVYINVLRGACGGAIINKRTVISAAHCYVRINQTTPLPSQLSVRVGSSYGGNGTLYRPVQLISHPNYDPVLITNDITVIIIEKDFIFSASVQPVNLPMKGDKLEGGTVGIVSGWGQVDRVVNVSSPLLKYAKLKTLSQKNCVDFLKRRILNWEDVPDSYICTVPENDSKDERSCRGDSGGPFVIKNNIVAGLVSYALNCGAGNTPTVYTYVAYYLDFINTYSK